MSAFLGGIALHQLIRLYEMDMMCAVYNWLVLRLSNKISVVKLDVRQGSIVN